jgi:hypothetical protein
VEHLSRRLPGRRNWPASAFWSELAAAYPDAVVLLSVRDPDAWS